MIRLISKYPWFSLACLTLPVVYGQLSFGIVLIPLLFLSLARKIIPLGVLLGGIIIIGSITWEIVGEEIGEFLPLGKVVEFQVEITGDRTSAGWYPGRLTRVQTDRKLDSLCNFDVSAHYEKTLLPGSLWKGRGELNVQTRILWVEEGDQVSPPPLWSSFRYFCREWIFTRFLSLSPRTAALGKALFLGSREDMNFLEKDLFRRAGLSHLLALSGAHLSIWIALVPWLLPFLPPRWRLPWGVMVILGFYLWIVGFFPSLVRAYLCFLIPGLFNAKGRSLSGLETLGMAWVCCLVVQPSWAQEAGCYLSFLAMGGIHILTPWFRILFRRFPEWLSQGLSMAMGAFLAVLPLSLGLFGQVQVLGLLTSIPAGVLTGVFLGFCGLRLIPWDTLDALTSPMLHGITQALWDICQFSTLAPPLTGGYFLGFGLWGIVGLLIILVYKRNRETTDKLRLSQGNQGTFGFPRI